MQKARLDHHNGSLQTLKSMDLVASLGENDINMQKSQSKLVREPPPMPSSHAPKLGFTLNIHFSTSETYRNWCLNWPPKRSLHLKNLQVILKPDFLTKRDRSLTSDQSPQVGGPWPCSTCRMPIAFIGPNPACLTHLCSPIYVIGTSCLSEASKGWR